MSPRKATGDGGATDGGGTADERPSNRLRVAKAPRAAEAPKPPKEWEREEAGTYRSGDGRFTLGGDGAGRWFVRDEEQTDDLGLPRTTGPYATLAAAKAAAADHREHGPEPSPLAGKVAGTSKPGRRTARGASPADEDDTAEAAGRGRGRAAAEEPAAPRPRPAPPSPPSWLETLEAKDREGAARARELIRDLETLGIEDPESLARRDLVGNQPEIAKRLVLEAIRRTAASQLDPKDLVAGARRASKRRVQDDEEALAAYVVARSLAAAVDVLGGMDRLRGGPSRLPGWELIERGPARRRLRLTPDDLA